MRFLLRAAFWLSVVVLLLPASPSAPGASGSTVSATQAMSAAGAAVSDMRQFCSRQPDACAIGSQALNQFGHKAQAGAKMLYDFLTDKLATDPGPTATTQASERASKSSQNSLTPADLSPPWRAPGSKPPA
jgi:Family of unknown function (DUF5330)